MGANARAPRPEANERITACRDPHDDKFLELAVNGQADLIVSGDADLLALNPFRDIPIKQGEIFLLPAKVPHSPQRPANTVGLVVEQPKAFTEAHHLRWHCKACNNLLHDAEFLPADLGKQIKALIEAFKNSPDRRTCKKCGALHPGKKPPAGWAGV